MENAGALAAVKEGGGRRPFDQPIDSRLSPSATRTASSTIGTPVTFERKGTVRDARGLTSMTYTPSSRTMNCAFTSPCAPSARATRSIAATIRPWSASETVCGGKTPTESPE